MNNFIIRNYREEDAEQISCFDKVAELAYRYHGDYKADQIFCAVDSTGKILAAADLEPDISWTPIGREGIAPEHIYRLRANLRLNPEFTENKELKSSLMDALLMRAKEIRSAYPGKRIQVIQYVSAADNQEMDFYLSKGFVAYRTSLVMKRDLTEEIPTCPCPFGITIKPWSMETDEEVKHYFEADYRSNHGSAWSYHTVSWMRFSPEWITFGAFSGDDFIGGVMNLYVTDKRSATENIFVLPEWRRQGIARAFITEALKYLKAAGKEMATLCVYGDNKPAIELYRSLGYRMYAVNLEFGYEI